MHRLDPWLRIVAHDVPLYSLKSRLLPCASIFHCRLADHDRVPVRQQFAEGRLLGGGRHIGKFTTAQRRAPKSLGDKPELFHVWLGLAQELRDLERLVLQEPQEPVQSVHGRGGSAVLGWLAESVFVAALGVSRAIGTCSSSFPVGRTYLA